MCNVKKQGKHWCMLMFSTERHWGNNKPDIAHHKVPCRYKHSSCLSLQTLEAHTETHKHHNHTHKIKLLRVWCRQNNMLGESMINILATEAGQWNNSFAKLTVRQRREKGTPKGKKKGLILFSWVVTECCSHKETYFQIEVSMEH